MRVIGTAGHVDHGKSTLVIALTGIDPDRLIEEKQRQMTIDLGFAWFKAEGGEQIGIVDVPGHRDFIENMLAGIGGIDAVLLVIAADEGIMPQTKEHLAIINLLKIKMGIVVLTKIDLVDQEWLDLLELEIKDVLKDSFLANAQIARVSAVTGEGIQSLKSMISMIFENFTPRPNLGKPRLPVDRVFSMPGFGTVVTGTLTGGSFRLGDIVENPGSGKTGRIRGIQSHNQSENEVFPGSRAALNISGFDVNDVRRGDVIVPPGTTELTYRIDAQIEILPDVLKGIKHDDLVKVFLSTSERTGRIRLLEKKQVNPGEFGWVQIEFDRELVTEKGDRFIIRRMSPAATIGGGLVLNSHPRARYRLNDKQIIEKFKAGLTPSLHEQLYALIEENQFISINEVSQVTKMEADEINDALKLLVGQERLICLEEGTNSVRVYCTIQNWKKIKDRLIKYLGNFHQKNPLRRGIPVGELSARINIPTNHLPPCVDRWIAEGTISISEGLVSLHSHMIKYSPAQSKRIEILFQQINDDPYNPPSVKSIKELLGSDLYLSVIDQGLLVQVNPDVVFRKTEYQRMLEYVLKTGEEGNMVTIIQFRDHFNTSRKYSLAFLEHLDVKGVTFREGEGRRVNNSNIQNSRTGNALTG